MRILDRNHDDSITLECGHSYKVYDEKFIKDNKFLCTKCVNEYLVQKNKEINKHFKSPIVKPLPPK